MKKRLTVLTLFIALCVSAFAQTPDWGYFNEDANQNESGSSANYTAMVYIDDLYQTDVDKLEMAPFCGDVRCGKVQKLRKSITGTYVALFTIVANNGDKINFKLFDYKSGSMYNFAMETYTYKDQDVIGDAFNPEPIHFYSVAQVGDLKYGSLQDAYNAAEDGDVITITNNTKGPGLVIDKKVTIDFNEKTYSFTEGVGSTGTESNGFQILAGNTVTLKDGGLNVAVEAADKFYILVQNYADLTIDGMHLDGTYLDKWISQYSDSYVLSNNSGEVNISNSTIKANNDGTKSFALDACKYEGYEAPVVTLGNYVTINGRVELTGGQLYHNTKGVEAVVKKSFKGNAGVWGTISVPMESAAIPTAEAGIHDLYRYDEAEAQWEYYTGSGASNPYAKLDLGHGYLYANTNDIDLAFEGELNVNSVVRELSCSHSTLPGFNLVGNPFAHEISKANLTTEGDLTTGFYIVNANGALEARTDETKIAPMEAFMVKATQAGNMTINKDASAKRTVSDNSYIAVNVANSQYSDVAYVSFGEGMGLDKIAHRNNDVPMVYIPVDGTEYAIAMMSNDVTEIPVSFKAATIGEYTIGAETQNCEYAMMTLVDRFTGVETNLLIEDYTFMATSNDNAERFIIKLAMSNSNDGDNENFAFINNGMMYIYNIEGQGVVSVYDVTGRPVAEYNVAESANISTSDFAAGAYIIRMTDENGVKVQKIVVE